MKASLAIFAAGCGIASLLALTSCETKNDIAGQWTQEQPQDIAALIPAASQASSTMTLDFNMNDSAKEEGGSVYMSSVVSLSQPVEPDGSIESGYEVNVAATASVAGTWHYKGNSGSDIIVAFDPSTLKVDVDNNGVTFTENVLTGVDRAVMDSLTSSTAAEWKEQLTSAMSKEFGRYATLRDVKVDKHGKMTLKIENPEEEQTFVR